jgi:protein-S-isoprenylcysteine O-methyltransferase Ste14
MIDDTKIHDRILAFKPPRIAFSLIAIALALQLVIPAARPALPSSLTLAALLSSAGFLIMIRAWWLFRKFNTAICPTEDTTQLITDDVYRFTRNPMYLGILMMLLGVAMLVGSVFFYLVPVVFFLIINHVFCPYEEAKLRAGYKEVFCDYASGVRRWI